jgi:hypothetical protein
MLMKSFKSMAVLRALLPSVQRRCPAMMEEPIEDKVKRSICRLDASSMMSIWAAEKLSAQRYKGRTGPDRLFR